jgi:hypothetical protein
VADDTKGREQGALLALTRAIGQRSDDFEHLTAETREAYVDGVLSEVDREPVNSHLAVCPMCAEDIADLQLVREDLAAGTPPVEAPRQDLRRSRRRIVVLAGSVAAGLALAVWIGQRSPAPVVTPTSPVSQAPQPAAAADPLQPAERAAVDRALATGTLQIPEGTRRLTGATGVLLGTRVQPDAFRPLSPTGSVVTSTRPEFQWTSREGATAYSVAVYNAQFNEVLTSPRVTATRWVASADLPRGAVYQWQVTAHTASGDITTPVPPQPEARFRVADAETTAEVGRLLQRLGDRPLELGILLAERGLLIDAAAALDRAATSPATADAARRLRATLDR